MKINNARIVIFFSIIMGLSASWYFFSKPDKTPSFIDNAMLGTLINRERNVDIFDQTDDRLRVLYFGYTQCPDVCPTSLAVLAASLKRLPESTLSRLWPVFISLDPKRDDAKIIDTYAKFFHPAIDGGYASNEQIHQLSKIYGVLYQYTALNDSELSYVVDHNSYFYLLTPNGQLLEKVPHTLNQQILIDAFDRQLKAIDLNS